MTILMANNISFDEVAFKASHVNGRVIDDGTIQASDAPAMGLTANSFLGLAMIFKTLKYEYDDRGL